MKQVLLLASCVVGGTVRCCQHRVLLPVLRVVAGTARYCWRRVLLLASCVTVCCYWHRALLLASRIRLQILLDILLLNSFSIPISFFFTYFTQFRIIFFYRRNISTISDISPNSTIGSSTMRRKFWRSGRASCFSIYTLEDIIKIIERYNLLFPLYRK